ncbi:MAG: hypothetical protein WCW87_00475 [Candidatus Paceibacterota bacterium]
MTKTETTDTKVLNIPLIHEDPRFSLIGGFYLTIPSDYVSNTQVSSFCVEASKTKGKHTEFCEKFLIPRNISDEDFSNVSDKLEPGKIYSVQILQVDEKTSTDDCLDFLIKNGALLVGMQGLTLAWQLKKECFPEGRWLTSLDYEKKLFCSPGSRNNNKTRKYEIPRVNRIWDERLKFHWKLTTAWFKLPMDVEDCFILVKPS